MLKEREVLMVRPSRETCGVDLNVHLCGRVDSVKKAPSFNDHQHQHQGRPPGEGFVLGIPGIGVTGGGEKCRGEDKGEQEGEGKNCSDDRSLAPSSPSMAAAAASSLPIMHEEGHSVTVNSTGDLGRSRAPAQNGWPTKQNGLEGKENGSVGVSEKRMRNGESLTPTFGSGNHSEEFFQEDCPGVPLRKRVHVSEDNTVHGLGRRGGDVGLSSGRVESSEGNKSVSPGVVTPAKSEEGKLSDGKMSPDSEVKGGLTPARTEEVNGEGAFASEEAPLVNNGEDVEMLSAEEAKDFLWGNDDRVSSVSGDEESPVLVTDIFADGRTLEEEFVDMDVDPVSLENVEPVGIEEVGGSASSTAGEQEGVQLQEQPVLEKDAEDLPGNRSGSPDLRGPPPPDTKEGFFEDEEKSQQGNPRRDRPRQQVPTDVEVIEFDDSDDDDDDEALREARVVYESDGSSTKGKKPISSQVGEQHRQRNGYRYSSSESTAPSNNADEESDSDDCRFLGSHPPPNANGRAHTDGAANPVVVEDDDDDNYTTTEDQDSDTSDVEEVGDSQSEIRRRWEDAAMRRRMGRAMQSAGSKANASQGGTVNLDDDGTESQGLEESVATSTYRDSPDSKDQTETSEARGGLDGALHRTEGPQGTTLMAGEGLRQWSASHLEDVILNHLDEAVEVIVPDTPADSGRPTAVSFPGSDQGDISGSKSVRVETPGVTELDRVKTWSTAVQSVNQKGEASSGNSDRNVDERSGSKRDVLEGLENGTSVTQDVDAVAVEIGTSIVHEDLLAAKERLKQTDHYRKTDAEEWASRQQEIERQAAESKRLRQRKRQEADRKREMERKQKERIEELRLSQKKEERQMDLRDQLRGQVQSELERIAETCMDFASLLRKLAIPVEGGSHPSTQQVNAAYKKALFKFHPDRAVVSSQGEPRKQVEAEEKFKLIQRLKDTLIPVSNDYTRHPFRSFM